MPEDEPICDPLLSLVPIVTGAVPFAGSALVSPVPLVAVVDDGVVSLGDVVVGCAERPVLVGAEVSVVAEGS